MVVRHLKVVFVLMIALLALFYAVQNVANLEACFGAFAYVMGGVDHAAYPQSFFPKIENAALIWLAVATVIGLELATGLVAAKGAWDLWRARRTPAAVFNGAKTYALAGCGLGLVVWLGLFTVVGGAVFQMWQTEVGSGSLADAATFFIACGLVFVIVSMTDE
jgi:predicted small integral membrane protein